MTGAASAELIELIRQDQHLGGLITEVAAHPDGGSKVVRARWITDHSPVVLKSELGELEAVWMPAMSSRCDDVVPRIRAHGATLADEPRPWLIMDDLPVRGRSDQPATARAVMCAAARFQQEAVRLRLPTYPIDADFTQKYGAIAVDAGCPGPAREVVHRTTADDAWLRSLGEHVVGHGDVHFWNSVAARPEGPWRLIDPIPRTAHWAWDAAYAQMTSGVAETPDLITLLAEERTRLGLPIGTELDRVRVILLGWSSMLWWALLTARRTDDWWAAEVERHLTALAALPQLVAGPKISPSR
ncbi:hypothetical protein [Microlunatus soli]|uniref:Phosphotransferase enzyme family protein n=1 Tax=Microlunatus soli TaxID=630515 RepID=A0A1H1W3A3_9ACTN|nr:hypothetical protein [Microlunatus soli]SDS91553.1 hypothetical protein SAMN04489812_3473 [Microlunatus soli]